MRSITALVLFAALFGGAASSARAENKEAARAAYRSATQHFNLGEYQDALADFKTAYRNFEDPSFLFNVAQCERLLGHKPEAIRAYRTYLANSPGAPNAADVRSVISKIEDEISKDGEKHQIPPAIAVAPAPTPSATPTVSQPAFVVAATPPSDRSRPVYKRGWFWATIVGGAAAVALGVGLGVGLTRGSSAAASATTTLGTIHPF